MARKQLEIAGTEAPKNAEVDTAAEAYVEQRNKRIKLSKKEKTAKVALIETMKKHKLTVYRDQTATPPLLVTVSDKSDVTVEEEGPGEEDDDGKGEPAS